MNRDRKSDCALFLDELFHARQFPVFLAQMKKTLPTLLEVVYLLHLE